MKEFKNYCGIILQLKANGQQQVVLIVVVRSKRIFSVL
jgi:hypothetical protein